MEKSAPRGLSREIDDLTDNLRGSTGNMKKYSQYAFLTAHVGLLSLWSGIALAGWEFVAATPQGNYYLDSDRINQNGYQVSTWELIDFPAPQDFNGQPMSSEIDYEAYDCLRGRVRILKFYGYSEADAQGTLVGHTTTPASTWNDAIPGTIAGIIYERLCKFN